MSVNEEEDETLRQDLHLAADLSQRLREDAKYFLEKAGGYQGKDEQKCRTYLRASVITAFVALEAWVNTLSYLAAEHDSDLELHERAFLREQKIELDASGYFVIKGMRYYPLEQKIRFLHWRLKGTKIDSNDPTWRAFKFAKKLRDNIVHPKPGRISHDELTVAAAGSALEATSNIIRA